jgi:hypothetical protein
MQRIGSQILFSPSDIASFVACDHLTQLERAVVLDGATRPSFGNAYTELIQRKGAEHEQSFLAALRAAGHLITDVGPDDARDFSAAAKATAEAIRAGAKYIYQATFLADSWRGIADFLERVERPSYSGMKCSPSLTNRFCVMRTRRCSSSITSPISQDFIPWR